MLEYIDSHCHIDNEKSFSDAFVRAQQSGVVGCVLNSCSESDWHTIVQLARSYENVCGAIGVHPWYLDSVTKNMESDLDALLSDNPNLIVGEIGLDKMRDNFSFQEKNFVRQLEIAIKYKRVVNLHCVRAWDVVLKILKSYRDELPKIVVHSFDGTQNAIDFDADLYFSYSPDVANTNYKRVRESVRKVPKDKILVESDSKNYADVITAARGVLDLRDDITSIDVFDNSMGVFFNG